MDAISVIYDKLESFIRKYYTNELIRGSLLFLGIGLLYFLFTISLEYFLWLDPTWRTLLFWLFVGVEAVLLARFILFPMFRLFKLQRGIGYVQASDIIGKHFPEVSDKLINLLQLESEPGRSELLLASIEQKADALRPVPFTRAVNFSANKKYLPIALLPVLIVAFFYLSGNEAFIAQSLDRVVRHNERFEPPAPFAFSFKNESMRTRQGEDFTLRVATIGKVRPESAMIVIGNEQYFMQQDGSGNFEYRFAKPMSDVRFFVHANEVRSQHQVLEVMRVPAISNFEMQLQFPAYLNRQAQTVQGTGNAIIPEGTRVVWRIEADATDAVRWQSGGAASDFSKNGARFSLVKSVRDDTDYQVITSNQNVKDFEKLQYKLSVIRDEHPSIRVNPIPDSLKTEKNYVFGQISDDYGISKLNVVYYPQQNPSAAKRYTLPVKAGVFDQFVFAFPSTLPVEQGLRYEYYFEVFDNDAPNGFKSSKSQVFSDRIQTDDEVKQELLQDQNESIQGLEKSLKEQSKQMTELDKLRQSGKEKENLDYKDQQKVADFLDRQKQQEAMMKEFAKKMQENLEKFNPEQQDEKKEALQERLENAMQEAEQNEKLLKELEELQEKIRKDELFDKMDEFKQKSKNQQKSLEQLVALTKKYYVEKKAEQLAEEFQKLGKQQEKLAESDKPDQTQEQEQINEKFEELRKELKDLQKENNSLPSPMDLPKTENQEKQISDDLKKAKESLQQNNKPGAKPKQQNAGKKMQEMGAQMQAEMAGGEMEQMEEDAKMLRQILDNLLAFSFSQEHLMREFRSLKRNAPSFNKNLKAQQDLKQTFRHVDDSLFAMSLRNPRLGDAVTKEIGNVHYNMDKSLESFADAQVAKGSSHQQYTVSSANKLADMLSEIMNSMKMSMSASGGGSPKPGQGDMQLPDIIQQQKGLGEKMKGEMPSGEQPGEKPGEQPGEKPGEGKQPGKDGKTGQEGKSGQGNKQGGSSQGNQSGSQGSDGEGDARAIMEIYKEQRQLREALENELRRHGLSGNGKQALDQMKQIEKQLVNKGFSNDLLQRMRNLQYELLKLEKAAQTQGEEKKRQAQTNKKEFNAPQGTLPPNVRDYLNSIEILNRQSLPLRSNYNQKVQQYFRQ